MLELKSVRFQNIGSFGNEMTEIRLDASPRTLMIGPNGHGKSVSILDSLHYGLYGKPYRKVKLGQLMNSITGRDMLVEVDLISRGRSYMVRRGHKPSIFEVYRDGVLVDQADRVRDQQDWLEKTVLMMDQRTFTQIVVLGSSNHVPFMELPLAQRREVIEDVLDIQVFSVMNQVLRERVSGVKDELADRERDLAVVVRELEVEERHLSGVRTDAKAEADRLRATLEEVESRRPEIEARIEEVLKETRRLTDSIRDADQVREKLDELKLIRGRLLDRSDRLREETAFYRDNDHCPTCRQRIDESFKVGKIEDAETSAGEIERGLLEINGRVRSLATRLEDIGEVGVRIQALDRTYLELKSGLQMIDSRSSDIRREIEGLGTEALADQELVDELRSRVRLLSEERDGVRSQARTMAQASLLLKDQGIKARIVGQYIPLMNRLVNRYLSQLELFVDFHLDENFNETIRSRHRDAFSYANFSEGEKSRINLAILFAWRDIARMRNSSACDLIIFDEILDSSLDAEGIDYFLNLLRGLTGDSHVFIISHREGMEDKFERTLTFRKRSNFSRITETGVDNSGNQE